MKAKPHINEPFGDQPVLDLLHITYCDLLIGRLTPIEKLKIRMYAIYPVLDKKFIDNLIRQITSGEWFVRRTNSRNNKRFIHLHEKGVEVYLMMVQLRDAANYARKANFKAIIAIILAMVTIALMLIDMF